MSFSPKVHLYLIRHAKAEARGDAYPDDSLRPLTPAGHKQAKLLRRAFRQLALRFDHLCSSPYSRAQQTAQHLQSLAAQHHSLNALASEDYPRLLQELHSLSAAASDARIALVGHEPWLSALAWYLLADVALAEKISMRKASVLYLTGTGQAGEMKLEWLLTPKLLRALLL